MLDGVDIKIFDAHKAKLPRIRKIFSFGTELFGIKKWGFCKVYEKPYIDWIDSDDIDSCQNWKYYCWEDQPEYLL